jgi:hypothetical protein
MNNVSPHCNSRIREIIETYERRVKYFFSYSSNYNLIELSFSILKTWMRRHFHESWSHFQETFEEFLRYTMNRSQCDRFVKEHFRHNVEIEKRYIFQKDIDALNEQLHREQIEFEYIAFARASSFSNKWVSDFRTQRSENELSDWFDLSESNADKWEGIIFMSHFYFSLLSSSLYNLRPSLSSHFACRRWMTKKKFICMRNFKNFDLRRRRVIEREKGLEMIKFSWSSLFSHLNEQLENQIVSVLCTCMKVDARRQVSLNRENQSSSYMYEDRCSQTDQSQSRKSIIFIHVRRSMF